MDIIIKNENAAKSITEINSLKWNLKSKKALKGQLILFCFGLLFFVIGMLTFSSYNTVVSDNITKNYTNWHLLESFGFIVMFISLLAFLGGFKQKKKFFKRLEEIAGRHQVSKSDVITRIHDDGISYKTTEYSHEIKWWMFQSYSIHEPYIFLNLYDNFAPSITVDKRLLKKEEEEELMGFVKKGLPKVS